MKSYKEAEVVTLNVTNQSSVTTDTIYQQQKSSLILGALSDIIAGLPFIGFLSKQEAPTKLLFCVTTATAVLHHHMSLTCSKKRHLTQAPALKPRLFSIELHTVGQHLVIARFHLLLPLSRTIVQTMSGVPHHCHHIRLL